MNAATLEITILDCRNDKKAYLSELKVLRNGQEFKTIFPKYESEQKIRNLDLGNYTLVYKSIFRKEVKIDVEITENTNYATQLCVSFLDYDFQKHPPFIDLIKENESYSIEVKSIGCFNNSVETIIIKRNDDNYTINWEENFKELNANDIEKIRRFEFELNQVEAGGCTTMDTYTVCFENEIIFGAIDGSCRWRGSNYLKHQLFGDK